MNKESETNAVLLPGNWFPWRDTRCCSIELTLDNKGKRIQTRTIYLAENTNSFRDNTSKLSPNMVSQLKNEFGVSSIVEVSS